MARGAVEQGANEIPETNPKNNTVLFLCFIGGRCFGGDLPFMSNLADPLALGERPLSEQADSGYR